MVLTQKHVDVWRSLHIFRAFSARLPWGMYLQNNGYAAKPLTARWPEDGRLLKMGYPKSSKSSGWWFQTFFIFHNIWDNHSHWLSYFSSWLKPPTSLSYWSCYVEFSQVIGVPPNHPFFLGRFSIINYPAIGVPSWLWKPSYSSYHLHSCEDCL